MVDSSSNAFATTDVSHAGQPLFLNNVHVDLTLNAIKSTFASGTIDGKSAMFKGSAEGGRIKGSMLGMSLDGVVAQKDQVPQGSNYVTTTKVSGAVGKSPTNLLGTFTVGSDFFFKYGAVTGKAAGQPVKVFALPNKGFTTSSAVTVAGQFGATKFSLVAVVPDGGRGSISGTVGSKTIHFDIRPLKDDLQSIRLIGQYSGPIDFLALTVGTVTYFGT